MKEGFWKVQTTTTSDGGQPSTHTYSVCRNHAFDQHVRELEKKMEGMCTSISESTLGNKHTVSSVCQTSGTTMTTKGTVTVVSENEVRSESETTYSPPFQGATHDTLAMDFTYQGACPNGMQPGDRVLENGTIQHGWRH